MFRRLMAWINRYERHLSAAAMIVGFIIDNLFFQRIDLIATHLAFIGYLGVCFISIGWLHFIESGVDTGIPPSRFRSLLPIATQFAFGGLWSGFLIFYGRGAVISTAWPFLLLLVAVFIGNEFFRKYHDRLVFTGVLFFFALYSYAILTLPVLTHTLNAGIFVASGALAIALFILFTRFLRFVGRERFLSDVSRIRIGALAVLVLMNLFYFTHILPPLPLALQSGGIYHAVTKTGTTYWGSVEEEPWQVALGAAPTLHLVPGEPLYAYSAVFAPTKLTIQVVHRWERYDEERGEWVTESEIPFSIQGGRDGGYRGYSFKRSVTSGKWRVSVETERGDLIGRMRFTVVQSDVPYPVVDQALE